MSDFWAPRGYVHVIANLRGTSGSGGKWGFFDRQEREDLHDLVEWIAAQPWCDGNVGMIGISYSAMTQLEAVVEQPPHLKAIFPFDVTVDPGADSGLPGLGVGERAAAPVRGVRRLGRAGRQPTGADEPAR